MASVLKWAVGCSTVALSGLIAFGYTDPSWTQRKFSAAKCPPFVHSSIPSRNECQQALLKYDNVENPTDVLVIGGGCVGTGVALDAVTRGYSVGLVEMKDYASGTSSRSTKLIHGGIRYLQKAVFEFDLGQLMLVAEALRERTIMINQAPHLCHPLPTLVPCYHPYDIIMFWSGTKMYDIIAACFGGTLKYSHFLRPYEVIDAFPRIKTTDPDNYPLLGGVRYYDGQMNDARLCYSVAMTAASYGAATVNYTKVTGMNVIRNAKGEEVVQCTVEDQLNHTKGQVYCRSVVNAAGPLTGVVEEMVDEKSRHVNMVPALGAHIVIDKLYCPRTKEAMIVPSTDGRVVFAIPWLGGCIVGTTDHPCPATEEPRCSKEDEAFLLKNVEPYVGPIPAEAVHSVWAGIRPLAGTKNMTGKSTASISREHLITVDEHAHMLNIVGGKWTTYRRMAEDAVNSLEKTLLKGKAGRKPCCTEQIVMVGARELKSVPAAPTDAQIPDDVHRHLTGNYGDRYNQVVAEARQQSKLYERLTPEAPIIGAEVVWAAKNEHCERVCDFLTHRTRAAFLNTNAAERCVPQVAQLMGSAKGWSSSKVQSEIKNAYAVLTFRAQSA
ncbi:glycerol-3-phosphate dehydrogenase [Strigomonas culicis]|uniref:Glycerol-3-phosphate dehydrogenase n=1 Tax=Strigomonas culicis TaxID=28005 RepID=S9UZR3_9TRYP|nr:glycerol-3-phosphate dehydrogenase [Strigomonas culicis]|eukprot:EPY20101.1 glycerol-3-phosphate dehydrogenase [Strigomonas culicis]